MMKRLVAALSMAILLCSLCCCASASQSQAKRLGKAVIGKTATLTDTTHVYRGVASDSGIMATLNAGSTYTVLGYEKNDQTGKYWYLICWKDADYGWYGWISANNAELNESWTASMSSFGTGYCVINCSGACKARCGAGQEYDQIAFCMQGNGFTVMDIKRGSNGKNWYNISVKGVSCWISEGLADYYAY